MLLKQYIKKIRLIGTRTEDYIGGPQESAHRTRFCCTRWPVGPCGEEGG